MPKFFINNNKINNNEITIIGEDVNHIKNVLRLNLTDELIVCDLETGINFQCLIKKINPKDIICELLKEIDENTEPKNIIDIFQGLPKADKMELIIQKSVELGAHEIFPLQMSRCVVKLNEKEKFKKIIRWQKISEVAAKQSGRNIIPKINEIINIKNICSLIKKYDIVLVAYEKESLNTLKSELKNISKKSKMNFKIGIIIGPEGGIEEKEITQLKENGAKIITLGKRILRTETVALSVLSNIIYELESI